MFRNKKLKSFTLTEIFVAMIIIAVIGTVCISFMKNRKDYTREYMYYSTYQNLQKVIDTILYEENPTYTTQELDEQGNSYVMVSKSMCNAFREKLNHNFGETHCIGKLANGVEFIPAPEYNDANGNEYLSYGDSHPEYPLECHYGATVTPAVQKNRYNQLGCLFWVDIDGQGNGEDTLFYDIMPFYISIKGYVIPEWGEVQGVRGYNGDAFDAGGNPELMSFDVVYTNENSNKLLIVNGGRNVSFAEAACMAGIVAGNYCNLRNGTIAKAPECTDNADCRIRLVKKLKGKI